MGLVFGNGQLLLHGVNGALHCQSQSYIHAPILPNLRFRRNFVGVNLFCLKTNGLNCRHNSPVITSNHFNAVCQADVLYDVLQYETKLDDVRPYTTLYQWTYMLPIENHNGLSDSANMGLNDLEWPWSSFRPTYCKLFKSYFSFNCSAVDKIQMPQQRPAVSLE